MSLGLLESAAEFRLMADTAPVMLWMSGPDTRAIYFNRSWLEFTGRTLEAELGDGWTATLHPEDAERCAATYARAFVTHEPFTIEKRMRRHDGEYRWVLSSGAPRFLADGTFAGLVGSAVDITAQKAARASLADLNRRLMEAHESERTRIARELHDDIGQRLAVLTMELDGLDRSLPLDVADIRSRVRALAAQTLALGRDLQAISHRLHPAMLEHLGLASATARFCREMSAQKDVDIAFTHDGVPGTLPNDVALCVFRVMQEAITNAVKHAGVRSLAAALHGSGGEIRLEVSDSGCGFDPNEAMHSRGLGLVSMRERVSLMNGELRITSTAGAGTAVRARVPLHPSSNTARPLS